MSLSNWMENRKLVLLNEKREHLFSHLPHAPDFHLARAALYDVLSRIESRKREQPMHSTEMGMGIPMLA
ncbi:MAG: hypothetical protein AABW68_01195 [archaeon]